MTNQIKYKEFIGSVNFSMEDEVFYGKIEGINDLVTFEGDNVTDLKSAFEEAVDDYIDICQTVGKDPLKSFKGSFNVRLSADMHAQLYRQALIEGKTLNQYIKDILSQKLETT